MVDYFTWQNVSAPKGTKQIMQDDKHSRINRGGAMHVTGHDETE